MTTLMECQCGLRGPADRISTGDSTLHQEFHVHSKDSPKTHLAVVTWDADSARFVTVCKGEV